MKSQLKLRTALAFMASLGVLLMGGCSSGTAVSPTPTPTKPITSGVTISSGQLQVVTSTLQATFSQGALTTLVNRSTNESYIASPGPGWLDLPLLQDNGQTLTAGAWNMNSDGNSASIQFKDTQRTLTMTAGIADDDLVLRFSGSSTVPGVVGVTWGILGLNLSPGRLLIPGQGGTYFDSTSTPDVQGLDYPVQWENQMVVYQGDKGSVLMYARDPVPNYKRLLALKPAGTLNLSFEMFGSAPWPTSTSVPEVEWRLHGFANSWTSAADAYKSYMTSLRPFTAAQGNRAWIKNVRGVVIFETLDPTLLDALAREVIPSRTVLLMTNWRQHPFDLYYPDYAPDPAANIFIVKARQLGFRIMLHVNLLGISEVHPEYQNFKNCQIKTADTLKPTGWLWDNFPSGDPHRFAYISPACSAYRQLFIRQLKPAIDALQPDALHLDAGGAIVNDGNGLIEGINSMQGMVQFHKDILAAYPNVVLGGESTNEIIGPYNWLAQRWPADSPSHPLSSYLMGDQVFFYGFLDQPAPDEDGFGNYLNRYEGLGVVPVAFIVTPSDLDTDHQRTHSVLSYQKALANGLYSPDWTGDWTGLRFRQRSADKSSSLSIKDDGTFVSLQQDANTLYQRAHGAASYTTPYFLSGWPAYDDTHLLGTDPTHQYWLTPTMSRPSGEMHLLTIPQNMQVGADTLRTNQYGIFEIEGSTTNWFDFVSEFAGAQKGTIYNLKEYGAINGAVIAIGSTIVKGVFYDSVLFEHPPYQQALGGSDFVEYTVQVPVAPAVTLSFGTALSDGSAQSDGVLFGVQVNSQTLWKATVLPGTGWNNGTVDLTPYAGKSIKLRLLTHPGAALNPFFDSACWNLLQIRTDFSTTTNVRVQLPPNAGIPQFTPNVTIVNVGGQAADISLHVPAKFAVFASQPPALTVGQSLMNTTITVWKATGGLPVQSVYDVSGTIGSVSAGGITKTAIAAIPPRNGETLLTTAVTLPPSATTMLFGYGLADAPPGIGAITNYSGVTFIVRANGTEVLRQTVGVAGWSQAQIDVSQWRGKPVLFELIADADQDQLFDFAYFTDLTVR
ncbi:hypothetical protein BH10ACI4_BH10ACI4_24550 [soil metagenome]